MRFSPHFRLPCKHKSQYSNYRECLRWLAIVSLGGCVILSRGFISTPKIVRGVSGTRRERRMSWACWNNNNNKKKNHHASGIQYKVMINYWLFDDSYAIKPSTREKTGAYLCRLRLQSGSSCLSRNIIFGNFVLKVLYKMFYNVQKRKNAGHGCSWVSFCCRWKVGNVGRGDKLNLYC